MVTLLSPSLRALTTTVAAALVVALAFVSWPAALGLIAVLAGAFAIGWPRLLGLPALLGSRVVLALIALGSFGVLALGGGPGDLVLVAALGVVASLVAEMLRRDGRPRLVESLSGTVAGSVALISAAGWLASRTSRSPSHSWCAPPAPSRVDPPARRCRCRRGHTRCW